MLDTWWEGELATSKYSQEGFPAEKSLRLHAVFSQTILYMPQGREVPGAENSELEKIDLFFLKESTRETSKGLLHNKQIKGWLKARIYTHCF